MVLLAVLAATTLTACGDDDDVKKSNADALVGTWESYYGVNDKLVFCFEANGTGYLYDYYRGSIQYDYFDYAVRGGKLILGFHYDDDDIIDEELIMDFSLSSDGMKLTVYWDEGDGEIETLHFSKLK